MVGLDGRVKDGNRKMAIEKILSEISKTLKDIRDIHKERLELEKESKKKDIDDMKMFGVFQDKIIGKIGKDEQMQEQIQKELFKMLGIKDGIDIDNLELEKE